MKKIYFAFVALAIFFCSCGKDNVGIPEAQGGLLPSNYIYIKDGKFTPNNMRAVNGSTFTFVNQSGATVGIYSFDSVVINKQGIADNTSYVYKKDTTGTIYYFLAGNQGIGGSITITP
jgi:plastocyanin